jgi:hypothetical protein
MYLNPCLKWLDRVGHLVASEFEDQLAALAGLWRQVRLEFEGSVQGSV